MSADRPVVLTFAGHYLPGFKAGGPIRTLANLVDRLGDEFDFRIVAADRDLGDLEPFTGISRDRWTRHGAASVYYRSPGGAAWHWLLADPQTRLADLIYLNGFFGTHSSILPLIERRRGRLGAAPVILAPRGEFAPAALALKPWKKRMFITAARCVGLHRSVRFQASSSHEAADIRRVVGTAPIDIAPDLPGRPTASSPLPAPRGLGSPFRLALLARISPMKNLLGAIDIISRVEGVSVELDLLGIVEDVEYWRRCEAAMARLPGNVRVSYRGPVAPADVDRTLAGYDAFLLPTLGENYGHVIREALSAGLPVLISDRTPWRGLEAKGAGADLPLEDLDAFAERIRAWAALRPDRFNAMREAARALGDDPKAAEAAVDASRRMFLSALRRST
jgi:glycosyltransferase involved in cell wall biosynthesis